MSLVSKIDSLIASTKASLILKGMGAYAIINPDFRRNFVNKRTGFKFNAKFLFQTTGGAVRVFAHFCDGKMRVGKGDIKDPDVTITFRDNAALKQFFAVNNPKDVLTSMLENELKLTGNLSYLAKFGHMSNEIKYSKKRTTADGGGLREINVKAMPTSSSEGFRKVRARSGPHDCVKILEEPFLSEFSLDDFPRLKKEREALFRLPSEICTERPRLITEYYRDNGFETDSSGREIDPRLRSAGAFHYLMANKKPIIREDCLLPGSTTTREVGVVIYPEFGGVGIWPELFTMTTRSLNPYQITDEDIETLNHQVFPYWMDRCVREYSRRKKGNPLSQQFDEYWVLYFQWKTQAVSHTIPNYPLVLERGLKSLISEAAGREKNAPGDREKNFYISMQTAMSGVVKYAENLSSEALRQAGETAPGSPRRAELEELARICSKVPATPAETLHEAVACMWICLVAIHMESTNAGMSVGRLDKWLNPYFLSDIARLSGEDEKAEYIKRAVELVGSFYLRCADHLPMVPDVGNRLFGGSSSNVTITLGGVNEDGTSAVTDMTYIFLKVTEMLALRDPNVNARYYPGVNSAEYLKRLCEVNLITAATPSMHNDPAVIAAMLNQGFTAEHARDWSATGCVEPTSSGRHFGHTNCMMLNLVAPLEMALNNGLHPLIGRQIGPPTGDVAGQTGFETFDDFFNAYKRQLSFLIEKAVECNNNFGEAHQYLHPTPFLSSVIEGPMEKGMDLIEGGALYNSSGAALVALTDVVDSMMTIKKLVYEQKAVDFKTLLDALEKNFEGHQPLYATIKTKVPKFGTDSQEARQLAREIVDFCYDEYQRHENYRGGRYTSGFWSMSNHVAFGILSGALPSGRMKGKPFTPGITPAPGVTDNILANMASVACIDPVKLPNNIAFNVKVAPGPNDTHGQMLDRLVSYARTYFEMGGMQFQLNVVTTDMLRDAMSKPDNYRWLLVRISGYNAYFVELNRDTQMELIERTEFNINR